MAGEKVLVIEDKPEMVQILTDCVLAPQGYVILTALDGEEGLRMALSEEPDLVILDLRMPKMSGLQVLQTLRERQCLVPVIVMTAYSSEEAIVRALRLGVNDYVRKPFELDEMISAIERVLGKSKAERAPGDRQAARARWAIERRFNPYIAGGPVREPDMFFGREELLKRIINTLHNNSIMIHGPRRIGKTSLLYQLTDRLRSMPDPDYQFVPVYVDLEGTQEHEFFQTLMEEIVQGLSNVLPGELDLELSYQSRAWRGTTILIVEDDLKLSSLLRFYFERQGYEVLLTGRGYDALEICREKLPHVVILDIGLPDIDGYKVCRKLRSDLRTSHIPIIFLTGKDEQIYKIAGLELGADDYITKPYDIEELELRMRNILDRTSHRRYSNHSFARALRQVIKALQRNSDKKVRLVLLLDEVDVMNSYDQLVQQRLRRILTLALNLRTVVAGVHISKEWARLESPWYNMFLEMELPPLSREETVRLIREPVKGVYSYEDEAVEAIWEYSQGHPQLVQQLCLEAVNRLLRGKRNRVTKADMESVYREREIAEWERVQERWERGFNPYICGGPIREPDMFFGREEELANVLDTIHNNHVAIYGERRIGKTSLLHQLDNRLCEVEDPQYFFIPTFVNLQGVPAEGLFYTLMSAVVRSCQPRICPLDLICTTKKGNYDAHDLVDDLEAMLEALEVTTDKQIRLVLLLDEGDELNNYDSRVQARLRGIFMTRAGRYLRMVWSGLSIDKEWKLATSPWYNLFAIETHLAHFTREEAVSLIEEPVKGIYRYDGDAIELILQYSEHKPFRIQQICLATINRVLSQEQRWVTGPIQVTKEDVKRAYQGLVAEEAISREVEE